MVKELGARKESACKKTEKLWKKLTEAGVRGKGK